MKNKYYIIDGSYIVTICDSRQEALYFMYDYIDKYKTTWDKKWAKYKLTVSYDNMIMHKVKFGTGWLYAKRVDYFKSEVV